MKKSILFYAIIGLVAGFFIFPDVSLAYTLGTGHFIGDVYYFDDNENYTSGNCSYWLYAGDYPDTNNEQGSGSSISPCTDYGNKWVDFNSRCSGAVRCANGHYWIKRDEYPGSTLEYYPVIFPAIAIANITITSPTTGDTITSVATNLVGEWAGIDPDIFINITLYFNSNFIGEQSVAKIISVDDWTGNFTIPLSYFGLSANGQWDLKGRATYKNTQLSDMYITTDLISPVGYNLIFNVSGFHTPYTFTDFDTWYDTNVTNYDSPSAWASGMIGYLQPILEKIAEFGARIQDYLDTSTAWQRGNDIGSVFPVVNAYILKINIFFGGFPIAQFFQWGILIMMGTFAIKIILKLLSFIPVIGGGG